MKSILFNTEMVKAILDGRKTQFRIPVNVSSDCTYYASGINKTAIRIRNKFYQEKGFKNEHSNH